MVDARHGLSAPHFAAGGALVDASKRNDALYRSHGSSVLSLRRDLPRRLAEAEKVSRMLKRTHWRRTDLIPQAKLAWPSRHAGVDRTSWRGKGRLMNANEGIEQKEQTRSSDQAGSEDWWRRDLRKRINTFVAII